MLRDLRVGPAVVEGVPPQPEHGAGQLQSSRRDRRGFDVENLYMSSTLYPLTTSYGAVLPWDRGVVIAAHCVLRTEAFQFSTPLYLTPLPHGTGLGLRVGP